MMKLFLTAKRAWPLDIKAQGQAAGGADDHSYANGNNHFVYHPGSLAHP